MRLFSGVSFATFVEHGERVSFRLIPPQRLTRVYSIHIFLQYILLDASTLPPVDSGRRLHDSVCQLHGVQGASGADVGLAGGRL